MVAGGIFWDTQYNKSFVTDLLLAHNHIKFLFSQNICMVVDPVTHYGLKIDEIKNRRTYRRERNLRDRSRSFPDLHDGDDSPRCDVAWAEDLSCEQTFSINTGCPAKMSH